MAQDIELTIAADFVTVLGAAPTAVTAVRADQLRATSPPEVFVAIPDVAPSFLAGGSGLTQVTGFWHCVVAITAQTYLDDDADGLAVRQKARDIRAAIFVDNLIAQLNAAAATNTYLSFFPGPKVPEIRDGELRKITITGTVVMRPSQ